MSRLKYKQYYGIHLDYHDPLGKKGKKAKVVPVLN
jgi:hypothetical protein